MCSWAFGSAEWFVADSPVIPIAIDFLFEGLSELVLSAWFLGFFDALPASDVSPEPCRFRFFCRRFAAASGSSPSSVFLAFELPSEGLSRETTFGSFPTAGNGLPAAGRGLGSDTVVSGYIALGAIGVGSPFGASTVRAGLMNIPG